MSPPHRRAGGAPMGRQLIPGLSVIVFLLAGCGGPPPITYDLAQRDISAKTLRLRRQLVIAEPSALQSLDSDKVLVRRPDGTLATLAHAAWSDRLPRLVQSRMIQAFENAGAVGQVGPSGASISANTTLEAEIRLFEVDAGAGQGRVEFAARLVDTTSGRITAARIFHAEAAGGAEGPAAVSSLDQALAQALGDLTRWTAAHI